MKKKRIIASLLSLAMIVSLTPITTLAAEPCTVVEGCTLEAGHDGECLITSSESENSADNDENNGTEGVESPVDNGEVDNEVDFNLGIGAVETPNALTEMAAPFTTMLLSTPTVEGDGTEASPYQLTSAADFIALQKIVNGESGADIEYFSYPNDVTAGSERDYLRSANYQLSQDVTLSSAEGFTGIGNGSGSNAFNGAFDGNGYTIEWTYDVTDTSCTATKYVGIFGNVGEDASFKDVTVEGSISLTVEGTTGKVMYVGSLAGQTVAGATFENCVNRADINVNATKHYAYIGGIATGNGTKGGSFTECTNEGNITFHLINQASQTFVGGISTGGTFTDCVNRGDVIITADNPGSFRNMVGGVSGFMSSAEGSFVGNTNYGKIQTHNYNSSGSVGYADWGAKRDFGGSKNVITVTGTPGTTVRPGYNLDLTYTIPASGKLEVDIPIVQTPYTNTNNRGSDATYLMIGEKKIKFFTDDGSTFLNKIDENDPAMKETVAREITISSAEEFDKLALAINAGDEDAIRYFIPEAGTTSDLASMRYSLASASYSLGADITLSTGFTGLGTPEQPFLGSIDGQNHTITFTTYVKGDDKPLYVGLIAYGNEDTLTTRAREYKNLTITGSIEAVGDGNVYVSGLIAEHELGSDENPIKFNNVTLNGITLYAKSTDSGNAIAGGLIGHEISSLKTESTNVSITGKTVIKADSNSGTAYAGGAVGHSYAGCVISNLNLNLAKDSEIIATSQNGSAQAGGIAAQGVIENCTINGTGVTIKAETLVRNSSKGAWAAGGSAVSQRVKNCTIKLVNSTISALTPEWTSGVSDYGYGRAGGITTNFGSNYGYNLSDSTAELPGTTIQVNFGYAGGIATSMSGKPSDVFQNLELKPSPGLKIVGKINPQQLRYSYLSAGIADVSNSGKGSFTIDESILKVCLDGVTIEGTGYAYAGGVIGAADKEVNLDYDMTADNFKIVGKKYSDDSTASGIIAGGLVGGLFSPDNSLRLTATNSSITGHLQWAGGLVGTLYLNGGLKDAYIEGMQIESTGGIMYLGGAVGRVSTSAASVGNIEVKNVTVSSTDAVGNSEQAVGGAIGRVVQYSGSSPKISNVIVADSNISMATTDANRYAGGLIGMGDMAKIDNCAVLNTQLKGGTNNGGILGRFSKSSSSIDISNSIVSVKPVGGTTTYGFVGGQNANCTLTGTNNYYNADLLGISPSVCNGGTNSGTQTSVKFLAGGSTTISGPENAYSEPATLTAGLFDWISDNSAAVVDNTGKITPITNNTNVKITALLPGTNYEFGSVTINTGASAISQPVTPYIQEIASIDDKTVTYGETVTLPATVSATLSSDDVVNVPVIWETVDTDTVGTKTYSGTLNLSGVSEYTNIANQKATVTVIVNKATPSISLTSDANENTKVGNTVKLTATVTGVAGKTTPSGSVTFKQGDTEIATVIVNASGVATTSIKAKAGENSDFVAVYRGDTRYNVANTTSISFTPGLSADKVYLYDYTTTYTGESISIGKAFTQSGRTEGITYTYEKNGQVLDGAPTAAGTYQVTAKIAADDSYNEASSTATLTIEKAALGLTLSAEGKNIVTLKATLTGVKDKDAFPGTVKFMSGTTVLAENVAVANGIAVYKWTTTDGTYDFSAVYTPAESDNYVTASGSLSNYDTTKLNQPDLSIEAVPVKTTRSADFSLNVTGGVDEITPTYNSSNNSVVTVDSTGKVHIVGAGSAVITVTKEDLAGVYNPVSATVSIVVKRVYSSSSSSSDTPSGTTTNPNGSTTNPNGSTTTTSVVGTIGNAADTSAEVEATVAATNTAAANAAKNDAAVNLTTATGTTVSGDDFTEPAVLAIPVDTKGVADVNNLTLAKFNAETGELEIVGGSYDAETNAVTGYIDEAGDYFVVEKDGLTTITLQIGNTDVTLNNADKALDAAPIISQDRTMVPLRFIAEAFGAQVQWVDTTKTVVITMDGKVLTMTIDKELEGFGAAPVISNGRTMVPLRYISEALGANVIWVPSAQTVSIAK